MARRLVYVIDDDPDMLRSTAYLLEALGHGVECFDDGDAFLAAVASLQPGCILTDLRMPRVSGYEIKAALAERSVGWPVILMTSENGSETQDAAAARGFSGYLRKPFAADQLVAALDRGFAALDESRP
jgi:two-component system, LuxR family, response regulator FixJ